MSAAPRHFRPFIWIRRIASFGDMGIIGGIQARPIRETGDELVRRYLWNAIHALDDGFEGWYSRSLEAPSACYEAQKMCF